MIWAAILTPIIGIFYLGRQIYTDKTQHWQSYACITVLFILVSVLFLIGSNEYNINLAGVAIINQKVAEVKAITEQNKLMAKQTVELINKSMDGVFTAASYNSQAVYQSETDLLKSAGYSDVEIQKIIDEDKKAGTKQATP